VRKLYVLAILATLLVAACPTQTTQTTQTTGSIGVNNSSATNWRVDVDGSTAGTVAANSSTVVDNVKPGVHQVDGFSPPGILEPSQWVTVDAGQTAWVNW
jgi:hypothetical protein